MKHPRAVDRHARMPIARWESLLCRRLGDDLVVYDLRHHRAYSLDGPARRLWSWCDGATPVAVLVERLAEVRGLGRADAETAACETLRRLAERGLLEADGAAYTRRRCVGALLALPVIASLVVPSAADAQSLPPGSPCTSSSQCSTGCCHSESNRCTGGAPTCL